MDGPPMTIDQHDAHAETHYRKLKKGIEKMDGLLGTQLLGGLGGNNNSGGLLNDLSQSNRTLQSQIIVGSAGAAGGAQTANPTNVRGKQSKKPRKSTCGAFCYLKTNANQGAAQELGCC